MSITYAMLKPDCLQRGLVETIQKDITDAGFVIFEQGEVIVTKEIILEHYHSVISKFGKEFEQKVIEDFVGKKVIGMIISLDDDHCIEKFRKLIGSTEPASADPASIRGKYSNDSYEASNKEGRLLHNLIHASDSTENAYDEIDLWFGKINKK